MVRMTCQVGWRFITMENGVQCVMMDLITEKRPSFVGTWVTCKYQYVYHKSICSNYGTFHVDCHQVSDDNFFHWQKKVCILNHSGLEKKFIIYTGTIYYRMKLFIRALFGNICHWFLCRRELFIIFFYLGWLFKRVLFIISLPFKKGTWLLLIIV